MKKGDETNKNRDQMAARKKKVTKNKGREKTRLRGAAKRATGERAINGNSMQIQCRRII